MASPTRFTSGLTQAASFQPLGHIGIPDPFFYAMFEDDFLPYNAAIYTVTASGGVVAADATLPNGRITFTSAATTASIPEIQPVSSAFQYVPGKKLAFLTRIRLANITTQTLVAGLITQGNVVPGTVADGIYFNKVAASTDIVLTVRTGSATIGTATISGALTAATDIDLGFYIDRLGNIKAFYGANLEGVKRQNVAILGPNIGILSSALTGVLTTALLSPTLAIGNGATAAVIAGNADFLYAAQER